MRFAAYALPSCQPSFGLTQGEFLRATVDQLADAESLGFDSVWVNEHHFHQYGGMMPSLPVMLAALSQRTSRVRLGTSVAQSTADSRGAGHGPWSTSCPAAGWSWASAAASWSTTTRCWACHTTTRSRGSMKAWRCF